MLRITRIRTAAVITAAWLAVGCSGAGAQGGVVEAFVPDAVYHNAKVVTVNQNFEIAQAVAIRDGRFVAVGSNQEVLALAGRSTQVVDLGGRTVVPGFYDNHIHLGAELQEWEGGLVGAVEPWIRDAKTVEQLQAVLRRKAEETLRGQWIQAGLTREEWPNQRIPTRWQLDEATPNNPLALRRGPHTAVLNSRALEVVGIDRNTPNPDGGWIIKDARGEPTGLLLEAARRVLAPHLPAAARPGAEATLQTYRRQLRGLLSLGLTSVNVAGMGASGMRLLQELYERYGEELPRMTVQLRLAPGWNEYDDPDEGARAAIAELEGLGFRTGYGTDRLRIGAIKMNADGGLSSPVYWSTQPYKGRPDFYGRPIIHERALYAVSKRAHELGWQIGVHTIGDAAAAQMVDIYARILDELPRNDHRHYLHHFTVLPPEETLRKMQKYDILVAQHPSWLWALGGFLVESLDGERLQRAAPTASLLKRGIKVSFGSDQLPYGPLFNIWAAVTRQGWPDGKTVYGLKAEGITVQEALRLHTLGTAYLTFDEEEKGSIEAGKLADLAVLGEDLLTVDADRIRLIPVERTVVGGLEVYARGKAAATR